MTRHASSPLSATLSTEKADEEDIRIAEEFYKLWKRWAFNGKTAALLLTPVGASAAYYATPALWQEHLASSGSVSLNTGFDEAGVVSLLFRSVQYFDRRLKCSLKSADRDDRVLARHAFRINFPRTTATNFMHAFMQLIVADRMAWALQDRSDTDDRPLPAPHMAPGKKADIEKYQRIFNLHLEWDKTLADFLRIWNTYKNTSAVKPIPHVSVTGPESDSTALQRTTVLASLVGGIEDTESREKLAKVENNFCQAALGLLALAQVRVTAVGLPFIGMLIIARGNLCAPRMTLTTPPPRLVDVLKYAFILHCILLRWQPLSN